MGARRKGKRGAMASSSRLVSQALLRLPFRPHLSFFSSPIGVISPSSSSFSRLLLLSALAGSPRPLGACTGRSGLTRFMAFSADNGAAASDSKLNSAAALVAPVGLTSPADQAAPQVAVSLSEVQARDWKGDILAVGVFEGGMVKEENAIFAALDNHLGGILHDVATEEDFSGKSGQSFIIRLQGHGFKRIGLVGLGKATAAATFKTWKAFGETVATAAKTSQASSAAVLIATPESFSLDVKLTLASAIASGVILGLHEDTRYKTESKKPLLRSVEILGLGKESLLEDKLEEAIKLSAGVISTRQLVNSPANVLTPSVLADEALKITLPHTNVLSLQILEEKDCRDLKMGAYLGVAAASTNPPKFIHLQYKPPTGDVKIKLAIVGKGLTFDSGGYNLKTGAGSKIELMKFDMGGAAAALGAAKAIGAIQPHGVEVHFIIAACENMISGGGMRPGDILTASNGKTIEVNNTDAEGRLTLADALVYACNLGVDKVVDLATLTGACVVALGNDIAGMFTQNDLLAEELSLASEKAGEKLWRLPMEESYWDSMKSGIADMVNTGGRAGGSILAALFLKQFVDEKIPWAHLDVAGPVWNEKKSCATGFAVPTLVEWILKHSSEASS
ncbi:hypothetical protein O6H91_06G114200 [Diphasiastrum complanatum]|uniref:Uncharacterized protein n=4 Tax=Diphasiastrum complanatum TaxID=34168 RepID=A0ACC2DHV9_DIPCM|nr:hypothetical protein O6H91_06G114200 [Diphasiastrum complanatum]KAJ7553819.1 hypothetical protein O6H91_06G114200 [Diphasiastrum complanatum]KAJ7553820.1 hypothetical protein O6H91_06G114200 [Diphasiastrum complanatum]KAJ7553821.1 hypothetical protein O6H91_06G114200 [Diphasiastrum complanatum]